MVKERPTIRLPFARPWNQPGARLAASYWLFLRVKAKLTKTPPPPMTEAPEGGTIPPMMRAFFKDPDAANPLAAEFSKGPSMDLLNVLFVPALVVAAMFTLAIGSSMGYGEKTLVPAAIVVVTGTSNLAHAVGGAYRRWWRSSHTSVDVDPGQSA
jgi:hypothetical protein